MSSSPSRWNPTKKSGRLSYDSLAINFFNKVFSQANIYPEQIQAKDGELIEGSMMYCTSVTENERLSFTETSKEFSCASSFVKDEDTDFIVKIETSAQPDTNLLDLQTILETTRSSFPLVKLIQVYYE